MAELKVTAILPYQSTIYVGFAHNPINGNVHLLTEKDLKRIDPKTKNPINELAKNQHPFIKGIVSVGGGLYGFGDWVARSSGFRDWQLDNIDNAIQKQSSNESKYAMRMMKAIINNEHGAGEIFLKSAKKYLIQNKGYVAGRFITGVAVSYLSKVPFAIPATSTYGDIRFTAKQIDDFARSIILGS